MQPHTHTETTAPAAGRRPLSAEERAAAEQMGAMLRLAIRSSGLPLAELAERAQVSDDTLRTLMAGRRRTRRSTLGRICFALVKARPELGDPERLADELAAAAGPALAPESPYAARIARRRERRYRQRARERELALERAERARELTMNMRAAGRWQELAAAIRALDAANRAGVL